MNTQITWVDELEHSKVSNAEIESFLAKLRIQANFVSVDVGDIVRDAGSEMLPITILVYDPISDRRATLNLNLVPSIINDSTNDPVRVVVDIVQDAIESERPEK